VGELLHHLLIFFSPSFLIRTFYYIPTSGSDILWLTTDKTGIRIIDGGGIPVLRRSTIKVFVLFLFFSFAFRGFLVDRGRGREVKLVEFFFFLREEKEIACS